MVGLVLAAKLVAFRIAGNEASKASSWYYKSMYACTNSDSPNAKKCPINAPSWACAGTSLYCKEEDKVSCRDMGRTVSSQKPDGFGFMCPSMMLGTSEMVAAARKDGFDGTYAVVTIDALKCGQCVEVVNDDPVNFPLAPTIRAQVFNSVADSIDVYMAGGGLGAHNGCSAVADFTPMASLYKHYPTAANKKFVRHLESLGYDRAEQQIDQVIRWGGGLRGGKTYADCIKSGNTPDRCQPPGNGCNGGGGICMQDPTETCKLAFVGKSEFVTKKAMESCIYAFNHDLHWNRKVTYSVIDCPRGLTEMTGLVPEKTDGAKKGVKVKSSTTTMEDCAEPSCSRTMHTDKTGVWKKGFNAIYTCNGAGQKYLESNDPLQFPCTSTMANRPVQPQTQNGDAGGSSNQGNRNHVINAANCATDAENCAHVGCCKFSGHKCWMKDADTAHCLPGPPPPSWLGHEIRKSAAPDGGEATDDRSITDQGSSGQGGTCSAAFGQCGGKNWNGPTCCESGCHCQSVNEWHSQCEPPAGFNSCGGTIMFDEQVQDGPLLGGVASAVSPNLVMAGVAMIFVMGASLIAVKLRRLRPQPSSDGWSSGSDGSSSGSDFVTTQTSTGGWLTRSTSRSSSGWRE